MTLSVRSVVRIISFFTAALLLLLGVVVANTVRANGYRRQLERDYIRAVQEITGHMNSISADVQKVTYVGTPTQMATLSASVWKDAGSAKTALSSLPLTGISLDSTYRFLSQVGDYSMHLSRKAMLGEEITEEEWQNLENLAVYAQQLSGQLARIERVLSSGSVDVVVYLETQLAKAEEELQPITQANLSFLDVEAGFDGYPTLIYDGPFSDNLLWQEPSMTLSAQPVSRAQAQEIAAQYAGVEPKQLENGNDEVSHMPSYSFHGRDVDVGVTKNGGFVTYLLNSRAIGERALDIPTARKAAAAYLQTMGIDNMKESYYELAGNILTVNYAYRSNDEVLCYTDLIKVGVAMDNGQVVFYDARGFINNHKPRSLEQPELTVEKAAQSLNPSLRIRSAQLALIPTGGKNEVLTYEFACYGRQGEEILVYVNTRTGAEENILILLENEYGTLAI